MNHQRSCLAAFLCGAVAMQTEVWAQTDAEVDSVVVTAHRLAAPVDQTAAAVTIIDREEIEARQVRSVEDLLAGVAGISVANSGGAGKLSSFFVRGADADQLLVLVDGVRVGSATAGTTALQNLPVEQIERIEFVRGPRSSLYGSEAIGGVLQIFTRRAGGRAPTLVVGGGSFGARDASAAWSGGDEQAWLGLKASVQQQDGTNACTGSSSLFAGCFTEEPDRDGYEYQALSFQAGWLPRAGTRLETSFWRADSDVEFDGSFANQSDILQQVVGIKLQQQTSERLALSLNLGRAWDRSEDALNGIFASHFETQRDSMLLQADWTLPQAQIFSLGLDHSRDAVRSDTIFVESSRKVTGLFGQYMVSLGSVNIEASLRRDDNQQFGSYTTGGVGLVWTFTSGMALTAQYGSGFKAPTFNELYYPFFGNPNLKPERAQSIEMGLRSTSSRLSQGLSWSVAVFDTQVRDLVGFDSNFLPANIDQARLRGIEANGSARINAWRISSALTLLEPQQDSGTLKGNILPRRVRTAGHLDVSRAWGSSSMGARLVTEGSRFDNAANTRRVAGHTTVELRGDFALAPRWHLQARVTNLLDRRYETVAFYPQPGLGVHVSMRFDAGKN